MKHAPASKSDFSTDVLSCNSADFERFLRANRAILGGDDDSDNPHPFDDVEEEAKDPSFRRSFAGWAPEDKENWTCAVCTYINEALHLVCAVCGKSRPNTGTEPASNASSVNPHHFSVDDEDPYLEQLREERRREVLELQRQILQKAALEVSLRENTVGEKNVRDQSPSSIEHTSSRPLPCNSRTTVDPPRSRSPPRQTAQTSPRPIQPIRPAQSAVFADVSEAEAQEMRKILSMTSSAGHFSGPRLRDQRREALSLGVTESQQSTEAHPTATGNPRARRGVKPQPPSLGRNTRTGQIEQSQSDAIDPDVLAKIAARGRRNDNDCMPELTSMTRSSTETQMPAVNPTGSPVRQRMPSPMRLGNASQVSSVLTAEEEKIRKEADNQKTQSTGMSPIRMRFAPKCPVYARSHSGITLDGDILQSILGGDSKTDAEPTGGSSIETQMAVVNPTGSPMQTGRHRRMPSPVRLGNASQVSSMLTPEEEKILKKVENQKTQSTGKSPIRRRFAPKSPVYARAHSGILGGDSKADAEPNDGSSTETQMAVVNPTGSPMQTGRRRRMPSPVRLGDASQVSSILTPEEEKIRKEVENQKTQATGKSPIRRRFAPKSPIHARAHSGITLDEDILQTILGGDSKTDAEPIGGSSTETQMAVVNLTGRPMGTGGRQRMPSPVRLGNASQVSSMLTPEEEKFRKEAANQKTQSTAKSPIRTRFAPKSPVHVRAHSGITLDEDIFQTILGGDSKADAEPIGGSSTETQMAVVIPTGRPMRTGGRQRMPSPVRLGNASQVSSMLTPEEEKFRKEAANQKTQWTGKSAIRMRFLPKSPASARAHSGVTLDEDILQTILGGGADAESASPAVCPQRNARPSSEAMKQDKKSADFNTIKKAAKGLLRLPFKKSTC